ncbi:Levanase precursor [Planctomycetes bacterium MalM25]|nr:Levanase precursor [Planctomycetes bacterium MalM25]
MTPNRYHVIALLLLAFGATVTRAQFAQYEEPYRGSFHFSPAENWTNEPNGLVFHDGKYHLFYQENAFNNQFGNQSWGHATSPDLVSWTQQPTAIAPGEGRLIYSGSAVVDEDNTAGFGAGALVAAYTGFDPITGVQDQRLAYSLDGETFTKRPGTVLPRLPGVEGIETRDPKVFWHEPTNAWKMVLTHGGQKKASLWTSPNLQNWSRTQDFFAPEIAGQVGGWEVPDLFDLPLDGDPDNKKWVLSITPSDGSPAGGNGVAYFVGDYDGQTFTRDASVAPLNQPLWADYGRDFDGQQSWSNTPDGRTIWTSVMQSYGESVPTTPWRGQMAFPREVGLETTPLGVRLVQQPIDEIASLRIPGSETILSNVAISPGFDPLDALDLQHDAFELIATIDPQQAASVGLQVRQGAGGEETTILYNRLIERLIVDRTDSGERAFNSGAGGVHLAPLTPGADGRVTIRALIDRGSVEVFGGAGEAVISNLIFPDPSSRGISLLTNGGSAVFESLEIYPLRSIWPDQPAPLAATPAVARWSMDATPTSTILDGSYPAVVDRRVAFGEGSGLGTTNALYEPSAAVDHLWLSRSGQGGMPTSPETPPPAMFANGADGGTASFNAAALANENGALFLPADRYGEEAAFEGSFTVELFFRTDGDRSGAGLMQLMLAGEDDFRFGLIVNEGGQGNIRFALNDRTGTIPILDTRSVSPRNFADGQWHYLTASFDADAGASGELQLVVVSEDGQVTVADGFAPSGFDGLPTDGGDGDLLIGRHNRSAAADDRTFLGLIDEVQLTGALVPAGLRLGAVPGFPLGGDFNGDGRVDAADYTVWRDEQGQAGETLLADADGSGTIDTADYAIWRANYGQQVSSASQPVPEPGALGLFALAGLFCLLQNGRPGRSLSHLSN